MSAATLALDLLETALYHPGMRKPTEYRRTCDRCGTIWYVTARDRKERAPNRAEMLGARMQNTGAQISLFGSSKKRTAASTELGRLEAKGDRVRARNECSGCGSQHFTEEPA